MIHEKNLKQKSRGTVPLSTVPTPFDYILKTPVIADNKLNLTLYTLQRCLSNYISDVGPGGRKVYLV
jgi:hypothetical protein